MFPLWDDIPAQRVPLVNYAIIILCSIVFLLELGAGEDSDALVREFGMIPRRWTHPDQRFATIELQDEHGERYFEKISLESPVSPFATMFTSMFLHAGWMHIVGNMWFLFIFGDNVEDRFGHFRFLVVYLLGGLAASILQLISDPGAAFPTIGASGAIAGVMGGYLVLYPHARVMALVPLGLFTRIMPVPAVFFLAFWFLLQVVSGVSTESGAGGVAWWAHIGGFLTGAGLTWISRNSGWLQPPPRPTLVYGFPQYREEKDPWV